MAPNDFNPYHAWLGLDSQLTQPSYYQLLGLSEIETDVQRIAAAAERSAKRVRSCIPGPYATLWTTVLDEISAAKRCLTDLVERAIYDRQLWEQRVTNIPPGQRPATPGPACPPALAQQMPGGTPPGALPWPAAIGSLPIHPLPSLGPSAGAAFSAVAVPAATPAVEAAEVARVESELAAAIGPTAKRRAAAIRAKKEESRAKVFATLVTASAAAVFLVAIAILALVFIRSDDAPKALPNNGGKLPANPPARTPSPKKANSDTADEGQPKPGATAKRPLPCKRDRRFSAATSSERPLGPDRSGKTAEEDPIPPLSGIEEPAPKREDGVNSIGSRPADNDTKADEPAAKLELAPGTAKSVHGIEQPGSPAQPTPAEVRTLAESLKIARDALRDYRFDLAKSALEKVNGLPMRPEHREKYQRLDVLTQHAEKFHTALSAAVNGLTVGTNIRMAYGIELGVVGAAENSLSVRVAGQNRTYRLSELPPALALAIADQFIQQNGDDAAAFKAAYVITHKKATDAQLAKAREWWKSAKTYGGEVANLEQVVDDRYDLEEDLKE